MSVELKWCLERGSQPLIDPGATLVFTIEILEIRGDKVPAHRCNPSKLGEEDSGCDEKEVKYIEKKQNEWVESWEKEIKRLETMKAGKMKPELGEWIDQRLNILKKLKESAEMGANLAEETKEEL